MHFSVTISEFEGPLDLMYHLIKENKLDLFNLDMDVLSEQYLAYLNQMEEMHLDIASEFLTELAGLLEYKSKKLLPKEKVEIEEEYEEDHRDKLVKRLLEYQRYKEASESLKPLYEERQLSYTKPLSNETQQWMSVVKEEKLSGSPYDLMKAMNKVLRRLALNHPLETKMTVKELSVDERREQIEERLDGFKGTMSFTELCSDCTSKQMVIVTFMAILDMIKFQIISYIIDEEDEIWIVKGVEDDG
ncbi:segregation/condensation protein A [uncultured Traorella sp.]|uniref:segregation and condensation protein A n=1 Tax=uncultured Traorella sp. TaxID=1929048 RepID=UPI0025D30438|nr:segregation/condensation protein A [uncultured Traorella sp.]